MALSFGTTYQARVDSPVGFHLPRTSFSHKRIHKSGRGAKIKAQTPTCVLSTTEVHIVQAKQLAAAKREATDHQVKSLRGRHRFSGFGMTPGQPFRRGWITIDRCTTRDDRPGRTRFPAGLRHGLCSVRMWFVGTQGGGGGLRKRCSFFFK